MRQVGAIGNWLAGLIVCCFWLFFSGLLVRFFFIRRFGFRVEERVRSGEDWFLAVDIVKERIHGSETDVLVCSSDGFPCMISARREKSEVFLSIANEGWNPSRLRRGPSEEVHFGSLFQYVGF